MGPLRRGLILAALPSPALAEVCDKIRPDWAGEPVSAFAETIQLFATAPSLALMAASAFAIRFRSQWGGLAVVVLWTIYASVMIIPNTANLRAEALAEGCAGPSTLFLGLISAICIGMVLYTAPMPRRRDGT